MITTIYNRMLVCIVAAHLILVQSSVVVAEEKTYSIGIVPQFDNISIHEIWQPIIAQVTKLSGVKLRIKGSIKVPEFEKQFIEGEFDFAYMNPYLALNAAEAKTYVPLVRDTSKMLYGIVVVRKDSGITDIKQLNNKVVAFPSANALGASLIPRADFKQLFNIEVLPLYVQSHSSVYLNVALKNSIAGGGAQKSFLQQPEKIRDLLKIIYKTREFAPHPIMAHTRIPEDIRLAVKQAFLDLGNNAEGKVLLEKIPIDKIGEAHISDYAPIKSWGLEEFVMH